MHDEWLFILSQHEMKSLKRLLRNRNGFSGGGMDSSGAESGRRLRDTVARQGVAQNNFKAELKASRKRILSILRKPSDHRTTLENATLADNHTLVTTLSKYCKRQSVQRTRAEEIEDDETEVIRQCRELAKALRSSSHAIVYTGAGISTSANIPDYRGTDGVWTTLKRGKKLPAMRSLTSAEPTRSHMCLTKLFNEGIVKHIVSQNCDGLHLRSGIPQHGLSEIHGNMYIEVCQHCDFKVHYRIFDVTTKTALRRHETERCCMECGGKLRDTIVHFGERSNLRWPHNWKGAVENAQESDLILCLGTSLKVLRSYKQLWMMSRPKHRRPKLYIVNLQWTPKDSQAEMKVHSRVDFVMTTLTSILGFDVPNYQREEDPLFSLATPCNYHGKTVLVPKAPDDKFKTPTKCEKFVTESVAHSSAEFAESQEAASSVKEEQFVSKHGKKQYNDHNNESDSETLPDITDTTSPDLISNSATPAWFGKGVKLKQAPIRSRKRRAKSTRY